jgi:hypothetical protein
MRILPLAIAVVTIVGTVQLKLDRSYAVEAASPGRAMKARHSGSPPSSPRRAMNAGPAEARPADVDDSADEAPYRVQFENEWVRLVRVHYPANAKVPVHGHPRTVTTYIYLSESSPVRFTHQGSRTHVVTRQPTTPGGFRVSSGGDEEHSVVNLGSTPSDFLRVELKTDPAGDASPYYRDNRRLGATSATATDVRFTNKQMRITRIALPAGGAADIATAAGQPALIVALADAALTADGSSITLANGQERWVAAGRMEHLANAGGGAIELLRIDLLTGPRAGRP